jgi:histone-lysine N-methyltransferase SETMAR
MQLVLQLCSLSSSKERLGKLSQKINVLHDNARLHMPDLTMMTLTTLGRKVMNHPPYSPDLATSGFCLFGRLMEHLGGQKFNTHNEL